MVMGAKSLFQLWRNTGHQLGLLDPLRGQAFKFLNATFKIIKLVSPYFFKPTV